jgi:PAS domain S-box-containing protein
MASEIRQSSLETVLITEELSRRSPRTANLKAENDALRTLAQQLVEHPQTILKTLVTLAKDLCQAGTAGVSLLETSSSSEAIFRWVAIAGELEQYEQGTIPRHFSPCGVCLERQSPQLYAHPARYFTHLQAIKPLAVEALVMPLIAGKQPLGAIWILSHNPQRQFDAEDVRVMSSLADFTAAALHNNQARQATESAQGELRQREAELSLITNAVPVLISFVDTEQRYRFNNRTYEEWFGHSAAQVYGKTLWEVLGETAYQTIRPYVEQVLAGQQVSFESEVPYQDGGTRYIQATYVPRFDSQGRVEGFVVLVKDISQEQAALRDRKQAEAALRQSEERLRIAQQAAKAGVWDWDITTNQVAWSEEYYQLYGLDPAITQASYENWLASIVPQDRDRTDQAAREALEHKSNLNVEFRILHPTQGERWITAIGQTFYDANQQPTRMTGIALDITKRKRAEAALSQSEFRFQTLVKNMPGMVYRYAPKAEGGERFTYVSSGSRDLFELEPETVLADANTFWALIHPDDLPSLQTSIATAVAHSADWQWEGRIITPSGRLKWIQGKARMELTEWDKVWDGLIIDISDRKQAEAQIQQQTLRSQILAEVSQAFSEALLDYQAVLDAITQRCADVLGDGCAIRLLSDDGQWLNPVAVYHRNPDARAFIEENLIKTTQKANEGLHAQVIQTNQPLMLPAVSMHELRSKVSSSVLPYLERFQVSSVLIAPLRARGRVIGTIGMSRDQPGQPYSLEDQVFLLNLADRAALGIDNARLYQAAQQANRVKDEFLAVLSHELRSPLNPILGWAKLLQNRKLDEARTVAALATIERNAKLQAELIEDLLDVSRILQGKLSLNMAPVDLVCTIQAAMETVRLAAEAKSIHIRTELQGATGKILGDSARIQQVIWNLLSNAVKFTPAQGQVTVRLEQIENQAQITVSDTGKGISPDFLPYVFDYFRQADSATTRKFGGLGLGLAIVRHLVELHGGTIQVESQGEGMGATFMVKLPLMPTQPEINQNRVEPARDLNLTGVKILVVDDDADTRDYITFLLEQAGAKVMAVASANEAFTLLVQSKPDLLLSDIGMPEMDGYMLLRQVRTLPPERGGNIPAIALTAYAGEINQQKALAAGFQLHLSKPIEPTELVSAIANLIA